MYVHVASSIFVFVCASVSLRAWSCWALLGRSGVYFKAVVWVFIGALCVSKSQLSRLLCRWPVWCLLPQDTHHLPVEVDRSWWLIFFHDFSVACPLESKSHKVLSWFTTSPLPPPLFTTLLSCFVGCCSFLKVVNALWLEKTLATVWRCIAVTLTCSVDSSNFWSMCQVVNLLWTLTEYKEVEMTWLGSQSLL